ncbi:MAG: universal stress protein [Actinomycetes bacterium]
MNIERDARVVRTAGRVVVGVDDGAASRAALVFGATLAGWLGVPLLAVHVYAEGHGGPETPLLRFGDSARLARETLGGAVERAQVEDGITVPITPLLVSGHRARTLIEHGRRDGILVVGRPQRHGHAALLPEWSVPAQVAGRARCPVAVVPASWRPAALPAPVSVGVDLARTSAVLLEQAVGLAQAAQLPLRVVHAEPSRGRADPSGSDPGRLRRTLQTELERAAPPAARVSLAVRDGAPGRVLEEASHDSAFLVVGRHGVRHRTPHRLGTVARHVLRTASCPVLLVDAPDRCVPAGERSAARAVSTPVGR